MAVVDFMFRVDRFPSSNTKAMAREFFLTGGGNAANATIAITRLGGRARFCRPVGDDELGQRVRDGFVREDGARERELGGETEGNCGDDLLVDTSYTTVSDDQRR